MRKRLKPGFWVSELARYHRMRRVAAKAIARAARDLDPNAKVYLVGSTVEGTSTVYSDVDVLVCLGNVSPENVGIVKRRILVRAMDSYGLPWDYPIELHVIGFSECEKLLKRIRYEPVEP